ncbi:MAG: dTDP-4-amino-4,6-dideoxygalactose transaminase [Candidatus Hydrogenedentes bacterium]|nr:dTDP-4-amino-4,6-dideoxygalactose transaminase [Candidatus Hydrogenedentota bacterium]
MSNHELRYIPFNRAGFLGRELEYVSECISNGHISGDGPFTSKCSRLIESALGVPKCLLTTSGTHALELAALLLDIAIDDEVIVPSYTFVSTINAFVLHGARPVFVDIRPDTLNIDERLIEQAITPSTRAIIAVHYAGVACEMDTIMDIASRHGVPVVEDNAHGLFARYRGRPLGTFGAFSIQSFHETKNFTCGEGGALLLNRESDVARAEVLREKGTDRSQFYRGLVNKYGWVDKGSSYLPSDILAAFLYAQLEARDRVQAYRQEIWNRYHDSLAGWAAGHGVKLMHVPDHCEQSYHMFYMLMPSLEVRTAFINHLKEADISAVFHYLPLHSSAMGVRLGGKKGDCPVTESVSDRMVRLPFYNDLTKDQQQTVIDRILTFDPAVVS